MDVKAGYKQTEVGVRPEDWAIKPLGVLATLYQPITISAKQFTEAGFPVYGANGLVGFYSKSNHDTWQVTVTCRGSTCGTVNRTVDRCWITGNAMVLNCDQNKSLSKEFFYHLLCSQDLSKCITGTGQPQIVRPPLAAFCVALPPTKAEQEAIAEALSDTDALIESLEQLLAKKRQLKRGAMKNLLTGRKRLPGFAGDWEVKRLGEIAHIKTGGRNNQDKVAEGPYPFFVRSATVERINTYSYDCEAILVPGEGGIGDIFHYVHGRFDVHQRVYVISQFSPQTSGRFVYFYMAERFGAHAMQNSVKATVDSLRLPTFQNFEIAMPPTAEEQAVISDILSDMDMEIAALEAKVAKARHLKQGMMQELLTGTIRLV